MIKKIKLLALVLILFTIHPLRAKESHTPSHPGDLITYFGNKGKVLSEFTSIPGGKILTGLTLLSNRNIITVGNIISGGARSLMANYRPDGTLNPVLNQPEFPTPGSRILNAVSSNAVAIQPQLIDTVVTTGTRLAPTPLQMTLRSIQSNGAFTSKFNNNNTLITDGEARAVAVYPSGNIVAAGYQATTVSGLISHRFALARVLPNGVSDITNTRLFSYGNQANRNFNTQETINGVIILPENNNLIVAGTARIRDENRFLLARYDANLSLNTANFNPRSARPGTVEVDFAPLTGIAGPQPLASVDSAHAIVLQTVNNTRKIVAVGSARTSVNSWGLAITRYHIDGTIDTTFGQLINGQPSGLIVDDFGGTHVYAYAVAIDAHNNIVVAGSYQQTATSNSHFIVVRYTENGQLDTGFGDDGKIITSFNSSSSVATALAIDPYDQTIIVGGVNGTGADARFALARYNGDPSIEPEPPFNNNNPLVFPPLGTVSESYAIALDSQGRILTAGFTRNNTYRQFALARLLPTGELDTSFGNNGLIQTPFGAPNNSVAEINSIMLDNQNRIITGGEALIHGENRFALARYTDNGQLDSHFGASSFLTSQVRPGQIVTDFSPLTHTLQRNDSAQSIVVQPDGKLVAVGYTLAADGTFLFALARYETNGMLDPEFGALQNPNTPQGPRMGINIDNFKPLNTFNTKTTTIISTVSVKATQIKQQKNGKYIISGVAIAALSPHSQHVAQQFILTRYNNNGTLDTSFGNNGVICTPFNEQGAVNNTLAIDTHDNILVGGYNFSSEGIARFALARYHKNGEIDTHFGKNGIVTTEFSTVPGGSMVMDIAITPEDNLMVIGNNTQSPESYALIASYNKQGRRNTSFGTNGYMILEASTANAALLTGRPHKLSLLVTGSRAQKMIVRKFDI